MSASHVYFYSFRIILAFQRRLLSIAAIITQDSERLYDLNFDGRYQRRIDCFIKLRANQPYPVVKNGLKLLQYSIYFTVSY